MPQIDGAPDQVVGVLPTVFFHRLDHQRDYALILAMAIREVPHGPLPDFQLGVQNRLFDFLFRKPHEILFPYLPALRRFPSR